MIGTTSTQTATAAKPEGVARQPGLPRRILVADDDSTVRLCVYRHLHALGYKVSMADSGIQALKSFQNDRPDLIILDIKMPGPDGFEVCRAIRTQSEVPIIFMTGTNDAIVRRHMSSLSNFAGANCFMYKPFDSQQLISTVKEALS